MQVKLFEIRDRNTFIPMLAIHLYVGGAPIAGNPSAEAEFFLLRRAGYSREQILFASAEPYILLCKLDGVESQYDPFAWGNQRTFGTVHRYLISEWNDLKSGDVIDVEYILGETQTPKTSERFN